MSGARPSLWQHLHLPRHSGGTVQPGAGRMVADWTRLSRICFWKTKHRIGSQKQTDFSISAQVQKELLNLQRSEEGGGGCSSVYILVLKFIPAAHLMSMLLMLGGQTPSGQKWKHVCSDAADPAQQRAFNPVNIREAWIKTSRQCFLYRFEFRPTLWWKLKYRHHTAGWPVQTLRVLGRS